MYRGDLVEVTQDRLEEAENRALGVIKVVVFEDPDLPEEREDALEYLERVKNEVLSPDSARTDADA